MSETVVSPAFLAGFTCLGAECEDTCCKGWGMQVDPHTQQRYREHAPQLLETVEGEGNQAIMRRDAASDCCVKLTDGLCGIQNQYGADFLSDACHAYPRMTRAVDTTLIMTGALSCPEITRLALFGDDPFAPMTLTPARLPRSIHNYLPDGITESEALALHHNVLTTALSENGSPAHNFMCIFTAGQSLTKISPSSWPQALPFHLEHAQARLVTAEPRPTDPFYVLQALCGLIAAAKKLHLNRLMQTVADMEQALHVSMRWDTLAIAHLPDSMHAVTAVEQHWRTHGASYDTVLRRYLAAQLSLALFPFAGFGASLMERITIIGVRFATVRLALMCASALRTLDERDITRIVQSLSRFLDHLADAEFSLKIYQETGWNQPSRMRALVGDGY